MPSLWLNHPIRNKYKSNGSIIPKYMLVWKTKNKWSYHPALAGPLRVPAMIFKAYSCRLDLRPAHCTQNDLSSTSNILQRLKAPNMALHQSLSEVGCSAEVDKIKGLKCSHIDMLIPTARLGVHLHPPSHHVWICAPATRSTLLFVRCSRAYLKWDSATFSFTTPSQLWTGINP